MSALIDHQVRELTKAGAPKALIRKAQRGAFHPWISTSPHPVRDLVQAINFAAEKAKDAKAARKLWKLVDAINEDQQTRDSLFAGDRGEREAYLRGQLKP